jgi:hypothetical protein
MNKIPSNYVKIGIEHGRDVYAPAKKISGAGGTGCLRPASAESEKKTASLGMSTDEARLNKTERAFLTHLRITKQCAIHIQDMTLKLGHDCRYTPDFVTFDPLTAWEVKGFMRDDAAVKLRVAARMFPCIKFVLVTKQNGAWIYKDIYA